MRVRFIVSVILACCFTCWGVPWCGKALADDTLAGTATKPATVIDTNRVAGQTLDELVSLVKSEDRVVRTRAVKSMASLALHSDDLEVLTALADSLEHEDVAVRYIAAVAIGDLTKPPFQPHTLSDSVQTTLRKMVKSDPSPSVKMAAAYAMCQAGSVDEHLPVLITALDHPTRGTSCTASEMLGKIGPPAIAAADKLRKVARSNDAIKKNGDYHRGGAAATALLKIETPTAN